MSFRVPITLEIDPRAPRPPRRRRKAMSERHMERRFYRVPGLHCTNCDWTGGWVAKGVAIGDAPCVNCRCKTLKAGSE